ncbi:hypothetical protein BDW02DRAFT_568191 [Decorospora gaudefroyi]|uniref:Uncharacterized protein n=1 Tax=Decorospora gaudefroyi TaxID=184978 RepID=A0A6A5KGP0_9PLEO|nr:hypothetical protein BDW02DRAFT_568191 [Decorospora gaudefroyi]
MRDPMHAHSAEISKSANSPSPYTSVLARLNCFVSLFPSGILIVQALFGVHPPWEKTKTYYLHDALLK